VGQGASCAESDSLAVATRGGSEASGEPATAVTVGPPLEMAEAGGSGGVARDVDALEGVRSIVLKRSESLHESRFTRIAGADFNDAGLGLRGLLASLASTGFQASNLSDAIDVVNQMVPYHTRSPPLSLRRVAVSCSLLVGGALSS
jgi:hypothetical protein